MERGITPSEAESRAEFCTVVADPVQRGLSSELFLNDFDLTKSDTFFTMSWCPQEISEFSRLVAALKHYRAVCTKKLHSLEMSGIRTREELANLSTAINCNADLLEYVAHKAPKAFAGEYAFEFRERPESSFGSDDLHSVTAALKSACRDWTSLGETERRQTYEPVLAALREYLPPDAMVFVPGAGLCRLAVEIASAGFRAIANENSLIMIIFSRIAMKCKHAFRIFPYCHQLSGLDCVEDSLLSAPFPEVVIAKSEGDEGIVDPVTLLQDDRLILMAGGFEGFKETAMGSCDAVVTCYFIDVVKDMKDTIDTIYELLAPGGYWINIGPMVLHAHEDDFFSRGTAEDVLNFAKKKGFQILKQNSVETTYTVNPKSHMQTIYRCKFFVARK